LKFPTISTNRFVLRQFTNEDLDNVFYGLSHPDVIKYYGVSYKTREATKEQLAWFANLEKNETGIWWAISSPDHQQFFGAGGFNDLDKKNKKAEVGFWLLPEYWGQGIMKEVMPIILNYAFDQLKLHRIEGFVDPQNSNCKRALNKLGFILEGTMKDCEFKNGKFLSTDIYAKFNPNPNY